LELNFLGMCHIAGSNSIPGIDAEKQNQYQQYIYVATTTSPCMRLPCCF
jgi:hypothetical protein